jgi:hypothetical protein
MRFDLHVHTTASDGAWSPDRVVAAARDGGLDVIAVTDHDTTSGVGPARAAAMGTGLTVLAGTELSSTHEGHDIHVLGYGIDPAHPALESLRERARRMRLDRMAAMIERLAGLDVEIRLDDVVAASGPGGEMVGRPHLARVMVEQGVVVDFRDAFDRYIADDAPAFVPTDLQTPAEAVGTIHGAGGVAVWAHPPRGVFEELLPLLVSAGLDGLEVIRPRNRRSWTRRLIDAARKDDLLVSGGSDWHNPDRNEPLGSWWVSREQIGALVDRLGLG